MSLQDVNFEDILSIYYEGTWAAAAEKELLSAIDTGRKNWLKKMLRSHYDKPIGDLNEIEFRDGVDDLIVCWNIMEIASSAGLISVGKGKPWLWRNWERLLRDEHVRLYYVQYYPERLPQLLLMRLENRFNEVEPTTVIPFVLSFLDLDRQFITNHRKKHLLRLFDDFYIGDFGFDDVIELLEKPVDFIQSLLKRDEDRKIIDQAVSELNLFFGFCFRLKELLNDAQGLPLFQAEIWARYAYWFEIIADEMRNRLGQALNTFLSWKPTHGGDDAIREVQAYVKEARLVLETLFSPSYAERIDGVIRHDGEDGKKYMCVT